MFNFVLSLYVLVLQGKEWNLVSVPSYCIFLIPFSLMSTSCFIIFCVRMLKRADVVDAGDVSDHSNKHLDVFYTGMNIFNAYSLTISFPFCRLDG